MIQQNTSKIENIRLLVALFSIHDYVLLKYIEQVISFINNE